MEARVLKCPGCGAPLSARRFQQEVVCSFCKARVTIDPSVVHASRYRDALMQWRAGGAPAPGARVTVGDTRLRLVALLAHGEISEVHVAERDVWPTERLLLKVARRASDRPLLDAEREVLLRLQGSRAKGAEVFTELLPRPVLWGEFLRAGESPRPAVGLRWLPGFRFSLRDARRSLPEGVPPEASVWIWRRLLEALAFLHDSGVVHGSVLPRHLLVQDGDHGLRLVGYSCAGAPGEGRRLVVQEDAALYTRAASEGGPLAAADDVRMSARAVGFALGGDGPELTLPSAVPEELARLVRETADEARTPPDPWALRQRVGELGKRLFGGPHFRPLALPV
jgi:hypothetical protein